MSTIIDRFRDGGLLYIYVANIDEHRLEAAHRLLTEPLPDVWINESEDAPLMGE
jgi:hypothetical protein